MSNIVIDARELRTSSGRYVERLVNYLQEIDHKNNYQLLVKPEDIEGFQLKAQNFKLVECSFKEFTFGEQIGLKKQIEGLKPDLVHFAFAQQPVWYKGKTVTTIHDLTTLRFTNPAKNIVIFKIKQKVYKFVIKKAVKKSFKVITPSEYVKNDLINLVGINKDKVIVTYEAADAILDKAEPVLELDGKKFIMYVGRPTPHKNLNRLIEAFSILKKHQPDLVLALAGKKDFNYQQIENSVKEKKLKDIIFTDFISEGQLKWMYQHCQAYVFPSLSEGFGLPGLEAMQHGAPVVSSNLTCLPEIYGESAYYFNPLNVVEMADAINEVLNNKTLRDQLIKNGSKRVSDFSWQKMAKQTLAIYEEALK